MTILNCKIGERVCIGKDIVLVVSDIRGRCVRLGIEAPRDVNIARAGEVVQSGENRLDEGDEGE